MEKSVGGVDLEELMRARQELDQERGVETDPNMYDDYNKNHEDSSSQESYEQVSEPEVVQDYNNNEETNDSTNYDDAQVQYEPRASFEEPAKQEVEEINQEGWVADDLDEHKIIGITQSVSDVFEDSSDTENSQTDESFVSNEETVAQNEPSQETAVSQTANEPKDLNMYDVFAQFEVAENANIKSESQPEPQPVVETVVEEKKPEPVEEVAVPVVESQPEPVVQESSKHEEEKTSGFEDLINELLAGYDLDSLDDDELEEEPQEVNVSNAVLEESSVEEKSEISEDEEILKFVNENISNQQLIGEEINSEPAQVVQNDVEPEIEPVSEPEVVESEETVEETETNTESEQLTGLEEFETALKADIEDASKALEETAEEVEESAEESEQDREPAEEEPDIGKIVEDILPITKVNNAQPQPVIENETQKAAVDETAEAEVITDYSKLKDILQQELEEAERAEIEQIEEIKSQAIKVEKTYAAIEQFNFVEEIVNDEFKDSDKLSYLIGKDEQGKCVYGNFKEQYNLAIFGKEEIYTNTLINSILLSLSLKNAVNDVNFIILDANVNSTFDVYNKSSYIFFNRIAKTNKEILDTLIEASKELDNRYNKLAGFGVKSIEQYNEHAAENGLETMPYLILVFNNYTKSSQATDNDKIIACLHRMLKYGRIVGIYSIVVATNPIEQDEINYNLPSRIAFRDGDDSVYTIGEAGAASLTDEMDVLYSNIMDDKIVHLKTPNISETEKELLISGLEE